MASWFADAAVEAPAPLRQPRRRPKPAPGPGARPKAKPASRARHRARARSRGAIVWIAVSAALLAGVVFVNLAVLRLNLAVDQATQERAKLRSSNAALQSQLAAALASPRIQAQAQKQDGLVPADSSTIGYVDLSRGG